MPEREKIAPLPWHVPVALDDVPEEGQHFDLAADADTRAAVARVAGLRDLPRFEASFDVTRHGRPACTSPGASRRPPARPAW